MTDINLPTEAITQLKKDSNKEEKICKTASEKIALANATKKIEQQRENENSEKTHEPVRDTRPIIEIQADNANFPPNIRLLQSGDNVVQGTDSNIPSSWATSTVPQNIMQYAHTAGKHPAARQFMIPVSNRGDIVATSYNIATKASSFNSNQIEMMPPEAVDTEPCSTEGDSEDEGEVDIMGKAQTQMKGFSDLQGYTLQDMESEKYLQTNQAYQQGSACNTGKNMQQPVWNTLNENSIQGRPGQAYALRQGQQILHQQSNVEIPISDIHQDFSSRQQFTPILTNNGIAYHIGNQPEVYYRQIPGTQNVAYADGGVYSPTMVYRNMPRNIRMVNLPETHFQEQYDHNMWNPKADSDEEMEGEEGEEDDQSNCSEQDKKEVRKRKRGEKKEKIKRPMNAFMVWAKKARAKFAQKFAGINNADISVKLGETWSSMTPEQKKPFFDEAGKIKEQHKKDHPDWVYQPRPKRRRSTGTGVTSLFAVTVNHRGANAVRHINTYKHSNSGLIFQQVGAPGAQVYHDQSGAGAPVVQNNGNFQLLQEQVIQRGPNGQPTIVQQGSSANGVSIRYPIQMSQSPSIVMATPSQVSQLQQQGLLQTGPNMEGGSQQMFQIGDSLNVQNLHSQMVNPDNEPQTDKNVQQNNVSTSQNTGDKSLEAQTAEEKRNSEITECAQRILSMSSDEDTH